MQLQAHIKPRSVGPVLTELGLEQLRSVYPLQIGVLAHSLADHPLLSREMLALAVERMDPAHVECRAMDSTNGGEFSMARPLRDSPAETIRQIDEAGRWVMLRFAEQLPEYAELIDALQAQMAPVLDHLPQHQARVVGRAQAVRDRDAGEEAQPAGDLQKGEEGATDGLQDRHAAAVRLSPGPAARPRRVEVCEVWELRSAESSVTPPLAARTIAKAPEGVNAARARGFAFRWNLLELHGPRLCHSQ